MITYGYTVRWYPRGGGSIEVSVSGCPSIDGAVVASFEAAKRLGYRRPSWWQLMRWAKEIDHEKRATLARAAGSVEE